MSTKTAKIVSYLTWVGLLIVFFNGDVKDDEGVKQHMNQSLICVIASLIPLGITQLAAFIFMIMGIIKACNDDDTPLPLIGTWRIIK